MNFLDKIDNYLSNIGKPLSESILDFLSTLDLDDLNEDQIQFIDEIFDKIEGDELNEKTKRVVRDKKRQRRKVCKPGYKAQDGKCVKMSSQERRSRSKGAKRGSRKKKGKEKSIQRKREKSVKRR